MALGLSENKKNLAVGLAGVPALSLGVDGMRNLLGYDTNILTTMKETVAVTDVALDQANSLLNPLFQGTGVTASTVASTLTAPLLTNNILKKFDWMNEHQKTRWALNIAAGVGAYTAGSAAAPVVMAGSLAYFLGKPGLKFAKGLLNRTAGTAWGLTGGAVKGAFKSGLNGLKGKQFDGNGFGRINPNLD